MGRPKPAEPCPTCLVLNIVTVLAHHPNCSNITGNKWKDLRSTEPYALVNQQLARKVRGSNNMRPDTQLVQSPVLRRIRRVQSDQTHGKSIGTKESGGKRRNLVLAGSLVGVSGDEFVYAVFWVRAGAFGWSGRVGHEFAVVDASRVVEGRQVLEGIAYRCYGDLKTVSVVVLNTSELKGRRTTRR